MNKTLQQVRDEYEKEINYSSWDAIPIDDSYNKRIDQIACRYSLEACKEALRNASENARVMTKNIDTENEIEVLSWTDSRNVKFSVSKQSILSENNLPKHR